MVFFFTWAEIYNQFVLMVDQQAAQPPPGPAFSSGLRAKIASSIMDHFSVLYDKAVAVDSVSLCPKMDLIAIVTVDGTLVVLRSISWQKLHSIPAPDLQSKRISAMCWNPDGNVLALGHRDGSLSLLDVDRGEMLPQAKGLAEEKQEGEGCAIVNLVWARQHHLGAPLSPLDAEKDYANKLSQHYRSRDASLLDDMPPLGVVGAPFAPTGKSSHKQDPLGTKLNVPGHLDVLLCAYSDGRVVVLLSGLFPLLRLPLASHLPPSPSPPTIRALCPSGDLATLLIAVDQPSSTTATSSYLLSVATPSLWECRHELKPLAEMVCQLSSLVSHVHDAIDAAHKLWKDAIKVLEIKLGMLNDLLTNYGCRSTAREAFLGLVVSGVPTPALAQYISQNGSEPQQQNLFRQSKATDEKCAQIEHLLREQIGRAAELLTFQASRLRSMASVGEAFQAVGLDVGGVGALVEGVEQLSLKAEEALRETQQARQNLKVFLLWLLDTMQHIAAGGQPATRDKLTFRHSSKHVRMLLAFLRRPPATAAAGGGGGAGPPDGPLSNTEAIIGTQVWAYFRDGPLPRPFHPEGPQTVPPFLSLDKDLRCISLRQQATRVQTLFRSVFDGPSHALDRVPRRLHLLHLCSSPLHACPAPPTLHVRHAAPQSTLLTLASPDHTIWVFAIHPIDDEAQGKPRTLGLESACFRLPPSPPPCLLQQLAVYGGPPGPSPHNDECIALLSRPCPATLELWKVPVAGLDFQPVPTDALARAGGQAHVHPPEEMSETENAPLPLPPNDSLTDVLAKHVMPPPAVLHPGMELGQGSVKRRQLRQPQQQQQGAVALGAVRCREELAVTGSRGVGCIFSQAHRLVLLDMEEDEEAEEEEEGEEGAEEEEEKGEEMEDGYVMDEGDN